MEKLYAFQDKTTGRLLGADIDYKDRFRLRDRQNLFPSENPYLIDSIAILVFTNLFAAKKALSKRFHRRTDVFICAEDYRDNIEIVEVTVEAVVKK